MQVPSVAVAVPSEPLSPTSVLSDPESFIDCESADDSKRTELVLEEVSDVPEPELRTEVTCGDDELAADSSLTLEKLQSVESVESAVTDTGSVGSRSVSDIEVGRRTSVIDPPSGFQTTSTPSSKEDLDISETVLSDESQSESETDLNVESQPECSQSPVVEVTPWTKTDLRASGKLFRGQSVDVSMNKIFGFDLS